jgi:hypothetical protein
VHNGLSKLQNKIYPELSLEEILTNSKYNIFGGGGAYIQNGLSVNEYGGLIHRGLIPGGSGVIFRGLWHIAVHRFIYPS